jgi:hypothetical protein
MAERKATFSTLIISLFGLTILTAVGVLTLNANPLSFFSKTKPNATAVQNQVIDFTNPNKFTFDVAKIKFTEHSGVTLTQQHSAADVILLDPISIPSGATFATFQEQAGKLNDATIRYQLSTDGQFWSYFDGSAWVAARDCETCTNSATDVNKHITSLSVSSQRLQIRAFLTSGSQNVPILNSVNVGTTGGDTAQFAKQTLPSNLSQAFANDKVKICHATHSENHPYVYEEVDQHSVDGDDEEDNEENSNDDEGNNDNEKNNNEEHGNDHSHHEGDIIPVTDRNGDGHVDTEDCSTPTPTATVIATKIVCDTESQLPNWGVGGPNITSATATDFIASHSAHCHLQPDWTFQWAPATAVNPGDNLGEVGSPWTSFGPTSASGVTQTTVPLTGIGDEIKIREQLKSGYIGFGGENSTNSTSAEIYCATDVLNYDNLDYIASPNANQTYYCVGLNVQLPTSSWDHSEITVTASCADPSAVFTITNDGSSMSGTSQYRIYRNNILDTTQTFQLTAGQQTTVSVTGNGDTIRLEADQRPDHPAGTTPQATLSNCGTVPTVATIVATKIVCDLESDLPNYDTSGGPDINSTTAAVFIASHPHCRLEPNWTFQWAPATATDPGDDVNLASTPWTSFGPTNALGVAQTEVNLGNVGDRIWMREALQAGYVGYGYSSGNNNISAEMYCATDVLNYDNYDYILSPQATHNYYCVAWNVHLPDTSDHSNVVVAGVCQAPNAVFTITNDGSGNMTATSQYRIYRNNILETTQSFQLTAGQSQVINIIANGDAIRLEADQLPSHTGNPRATIEQCGTPNQPPIASDDTASTLQNTQVVIDILSNDTDPDGTLVPSTVTITSGPTHGAIDSINGLTGAVSYTPTANYFGTDTFVYQICDNNALCDTATVTITVKTPPIAVDDTVATPFETPITVNVLANDSDSDGTLVPGSVAIMSSPTHGTITNIDNTTGQINYAPNTGFTGTEFFTYQVCDNDNQCDTATVAVSVDARLLHPPIALDDSGATPRNSSVVIDVLANDYDSDGTLAPNTALVTTPPAHGTITLINPTSGAMTYQPSTGYSGTDQFTYQICDNDGLCDTANVVIHVIAPTPIPPVALDDSTSTTQNLPVTIPVLDNDSDADGVVVPATVVVFSEPLNGSVAIDNTTGAITYTPTHGFNGVDTLTYQVCDNDNLCDTANVTIAVNALLPPVANNDAATTSPVTPVIINLLNNDSDADGSLVPASVIISILPSHGAIAVNSINGQATYTPNTGFSGVDVFTYLVCDNDGLCSGASAQIVVTAPAPIAPIANDDAATTNQDTSTAISVLINDSDSDGTLAPNTVSVIIPPDNGSITNLNPITGQITYTPNAGYTGLDTFTYQVCDNDGLCDSATVTIGIAGVHVPPVANNDTVNTLVNVPVTISVLNNDLDVDGTLVPSSVAIVSTATHGTTAISPATGAITYTPTADFSGADTLTYQVCDNDSLCDTAIVTIAVNPPDTLPVTLQASTPVPPPLVVSATVPQTQIISPTIIPATIIPAGALIFGGNQFVLAAQSQPLSKHGVLQIAINEPQTFYLEAKGASSANLVNLDTKTVYPLTYNADLKLWTATFSFPTAGTFRLQGQISNGSQTYTREINQIVVTDPSTVTANNNPANATITVFEQDIATGNFHVWNGNTYAYTNPFPVTGTFSLILPAGQFYIRVDGTGFNSVTSRIITLDQQSLVSAHIALTGSGSPIAQLIASLTRTNRSNNFDVAISQLPEPQQLALGAAVPGITAHSDTGPNVDLVATQQKPMVIMVYGNWNTLAQQQLAIFSNVATTFGSDVNFIPLSTMDPDAADLAYLKRGNYNLKFYKPTDKFFDQYFISSLPQFFILNTQHQLLTSITGPQSADSLSSTIKRALQNQ